MQKFKERNNLEMFVGGTTTYLNILVTQACTRFYNGLCTELTNHNQVHIDRGGCYKIISKH